MPISPELTRSNKINLENRNDYNVDEVLPLAPFTKIRKTIDREFSESIQVPKNLQKNSNSLLVKYPRLHTHYHLQERNLTNAT